jgi:SAM-dependent methyltransferase
LAALLGAATTDIVLCHGALEYVDDPRQAVLDALSVLVPGGMLSLLVHQRLGAVLARAMAGRFAEATRLLDDPLGNAGEADPVPRRFDEAQLLDFLDGTGAQIKLTHGIRLFTDLLPGALVDAEVGGLQALLALERAASAHPDHPSLAALAAQLHLVVEVSPRE